jgi:hypothetical protein
VDAVILFGTGFVIKVKKYKEILDLYCSAIGMEVSINFQSCLMVY